LYSSVACTEESEVKENENKRNGEGKTEVIYCVKCRIYISRTNIKDRFKRFPSEKERIK